MIKNPDECYEATQQAHAKYVFVFAAVAVTALLRHIVRYVFKLPTPYGVFAICLGAMGSFASIYFNVLPSTIMMASKSFEHLPGIYLPVLIFSCCFCSDIHAFLKFLPQVLLISIPVAIINACFCGLLMGLIINPKWSALDGLIMGFLLSATYSLDVVCFLKKISSHTQHITMLLTGEMIISAPFAMLVHEMLKAIIEGWIVYWYQYIAGPIRMIVVGIPLCYLVGAFGAYMMRLTADDPINVLLISLAMCFGSYHFCQKAMGAGALGVMFTGLMMGEERKGLSDDIERFIIGSWQIFLHATNGVLFLLTGIMIPLVLTASFHIEDFTFVLVTYLMSNMGRFLSFFLFSPILSRIGYGMTLQNMILCVWAGLKNPMTLSLAHNLRTVYGDDELKAQLFFMHSVFVYMLYLLINGSSVPFLLKVLGLSELSITRHSTMNTCMKYIHQARDRSIAILKMDRFLSDANWPLIHLATTMTHPYKDMEKKDTKMKNEDDEFIFGYRFAMCPDCKKTIPADPTTKELKEMSREAKMRVLKLKKIAYSRQFEYGLLSVRGVRILHQAVEIAMDTDEAVIELEGLYKMFKKDSWVHRNVRKNLLRVLRSEHDVMNRPKTRFRCVCHLIVKNIWFQIMMYVLVFLNCILLVYHIWKIFEPTEAILFLFIDLTFFIVFFVEFWLTVNAYAYIHICQHGFATYFRSVWHLTDFLALCTIFIEVVVDCLVIALNFSNAQLSIYLYFVWVFLVIRSFRLLRNFKFITVFKMIFARVIKYLDSKISRHKAMAYELGLNYVAAEDEILEILLNIVDNDRIRENLRQVIERDRVSISKQLGLSEKDRPWIALTVKTKLAVMTVLRSMEDDINDLKISGWVDRAEFLNLQNSLNEKYNDARKIKFVAMPTPKEIFQNVVWMGDDEKVINFLFKNVASKKFDPGDVVISQGALVEGIYIVIAGLFRLSYTPNFIDLEKFGNTGALPIVDYLSSSRFEEHTSEYLVPGNSIGELGTLTRRPYSCMIVAETYSQVFILSRNILTKAFEMDADPVKGLECRLWKNISYPIALPIMINIPSYFSYTQEKLKYVIEKSFVPDIGNFKMFLVNHMIESIVLIEGVISDYGTRDVYTGPCHLPKTIKKLILPQSSRSSIVSEIPTKLLIVPATNYNEYDIMVNEELHCELIDDKVSKCLQHYVQAKHSKTLVHRTSFNRLGGKSEDRSKVNFASLPSLDENLSHRTSSHNKSIDSK